MAEDDNLARHKQPPRAGRFQPGQSGNPRGRPKGAKNLQTYMREELAKKVTIVEQGRSRRIPKSEAIAIQLVNKASAGDPKGLAAIINLTREYDAALPDARLEVLSKAEDAAVAEGIIARIRGSAPPAQDLNQQSPELSTQPDEHLTEHE